jgi:malate synthase
MTLELTHPRPVDRAEEILSPDALAFVEALHQRFAGRRNDLLAARREQRSEAARTGRLDFSLLRRRSASPTGGWRRPRPPYRTAGSR